MPPRMSTQVSTLPGLCRSAIELLSLRVLSNFRCCLPFTCPCHGMYMGCVREHSRILFAVMCVAQRLTIGIVNWLQEDLQRLQCSCFGIII